jgi:hypothetical protein
MVRRDREEVSCHSETGCWCGREVVTHGDYRPAAGVTHAARSGYPRTQASDGGRASPKSSLTYLARPHSNGRWVRRPGFVYTRQGLAPDRSRRQRAHENRGRAPGGTERRCEKAATRSRPRPRSAASRVVSRSTTAAWTTYPPHGRLSKLSQDCGHQSKRRERQPQSGHTTPGAERFVVTIQVWPRRGGLSSSTVMVPVVVPSVGLSQASRSRSRRRGPEPRARRAPPSGVAEAASPARRR